MKIPVKLDVSVFQNSVFSKTQTVPSIDKGETTTVSFTNLKLPASAFGANATVRVEVGKVRGEHNLSNNRASYPVFFSLPSNG